MWMLMPTRNMLFPPVTLAPLVKSQWARVTVLFCNSQFNTGASSIIHFKITAGLYIIPTIPFIQIARKTELTKFIYVCIIFKIKIGHYFQSKNMFLKIFKHWKTNEPYTGFFLRAKSIYFKWQWIRKKLIFSLILN